MDWIFSLDRDELKQVYSLSEIRSERVARHLDEELANRSNDYETGLYIFRDQAFGLYWSKVVDEKQALSERDIEELLLSEFPTSKSVLGEAIIKSKVSTASCKQIAKSCEPESWLYKQAKSFVSLSSYKEDPQPEHLEELISLTCEWALHTVVDLVDESNLNLFDDMLQRNKIVPRKVRNRLANEIKRRQKRDRHIKSSLRSKKQ